MRSVNLRGESYEITNASDIIVTIITEELQSGMRNALSQSQVAYAMKSACPDLPSELVTHRLIKLPDDYTEEVFTQNLDADEIAYFGVVLTIGMLEARIERLKKLESKTEDKARVEKAIATFQGVIDSAADGIENMQVEILLTGVEQAEKQKPRQSNKKKTTSGFAPSAITPKKRVSNSLEMDRLAEIKSQMSTLEAELSKISTVDVASKEVI